MVVLVLQTGQASKQCIECDKTKGLDVCPVCKTENTIKRMIE